MRLLWATFWFVQACLILSGWREEDVAEIRIEHVYLCAYWKKKHHIEETQQLQYKFSTHVVQIAVWFRMSWSLMQSPIKISNIKEYRKILFHPHIYIYWFCFILVEDVHLLLRSELHFHSNWHPTAKHWSLSAWRCCIKKCNSPWRIACRTALVWIKTKSLSGVWAWHNFLSHVKKSQIHLSPVHVNSVCFKWKGIADLQVLPQSYVQDGPSSSIKLVSISIN